MRLICPNCGAQYEVADDVIPTAGRDVQCSNCGHTWFETPGASEQAEADALAAAEAAAAPDPDPIPEPEPEPTPEPDPAPEPELAAPADPEPDPAPAAEDSDAADADDDIALPTPSDMPAAPERPPLDDAIAGILREEAAREEATRAAEAQTGLEQQSDLGLDDLPTMTPQKRAEAEARVNHLKGADGGAASNRDAVAETIAASRRELLPDIEEINSTLRSDSERDAPPPLPEEEIAEQKRGFRSGFMSMLFLIAVLLVIYLAADQIAAAVPALEGVLSSYVAGVDALRLWLDAQVEKILVMVEPSEADN